MVDLVDFAVFIGSFSPWHDGHRKVALNSLERAENLIVCVGKANDSVNTRNPLTVDQRIQLIRQSMPGHLLPRIHFCRANNYLYNDNKWIEGVQEAVEKVVDTVGIQDPKIALTGAWALRARFNVPILSSTIIRDQIYNGTFTGRGMQRDATDTLDHWTNGSVWERLRNDYKYEQAYEQQWGKGPHSTVDALVVQAGHILLIRRGKEYGHGLYALPGGFINPREKVADAALRELGEETKIEVPEKILKAKLGAPKFFDYPYRSNRSTIYTHVFPIMLDNVGRLPKVVGSDDAMSAEWVPLWEIDSMQTKFFEDHWHIIDDLLR